MSKNQNRFYIPDAIPNADATSCLVWAYTGADKAIAPAADPAAYPAGHADNPATKDVLLRLSTHGNVQVRADGAVSRGDRLSCSDTGGKAGYLKLSATGNAVFAYALEDAVDGQLFNARIVDPGQTAP